MSKRGRAKSSNVGSDRTFGHARRSLVGLVCVLAFGVMLTLGVSVASAGVVNVTFTGEGEGTVTSNPAGLDCSNVPGSTHTTCSYDYGFFFGTIKLIATPANGWSFLSWSGDAGGSCTGAVNPCDTGTLLASTFNATADFAPAPDQPSAITGAASEVSFPSARLSGEVIPNSDAFPVTDCRFEYGPTTAYGEWASCAQSIGTGTSPVGVSAVIGPLGSATTYHYRLAVSNASGTTYGKDRTLAAATAPAEECPNAAIRAQQGPLAQSLPDCMAYEQVTPEHTSGQRSGIISVSEDGEAGVFHSFGGLADTPNLPDLGVQYATKRGTDGWTASAIAPPADEFPFIGTFAAQDWSPDGSRSLWFVNLKSDEGTNNWTPVEREPDGTFHVAGVTQKNDASMQTPVGTSSDLRTVVQSTTTRPPLTDGTVDTRNANKASLYVSRRSATGSLSTSQVAYRAGASMFPATCAVSLGSSSRARAAVSANGTKIFFSSACKTPADQRVWAKVGDADPIDLSASQCDDGNCGSEAVALFEGAARDGSRVFFTTQQKLVDGDQDTTKKNDLYEYDFNATGDKLRPITASLEAEGAGVVRVVRVSEDGSHVYFVANGRPLATANARGKTPVSGDQNLYVYRRAEGQATGSILFIGALDPVADSALWSARIPAEATPDGRFLLFLSVANLTGEKLPGDTYKDLYRYDSQNDELRRIWSTDPAHNGTVRTGEPTMEGIPEQISLQSQWSASRMISDDGQTIAFDTTEPLSPWDENHVSDVYLWRADTGRFTMLSSGRADAVTLATAPTALTGYSTMSSSGASVFFNSYAPLLASHTSGQTAAFVARRDGGFLEPEAPPAQCVGDTCQGSGPQPPASTAPGSETFRGAGNAAAPAEGPSTKLKVAKVKPVVNGITARLRVTVSGKGQITASGSGVKRAKRAAAKAGTYPVTVHLSPKAQRALRQAHKVTVQVTVRFAPEKGKASMVKRSVVFRARQQAGRSSASSSHGERRANVLSSSARKER
jgi:hypothetical protein